MCYNFDFLKKEDKYKDFTYACIEAEKSLVVSYASMSTPGHFEPWDQKTGATVPEI